MDRLVTARAPASSALQKRGVITSTDHDHARCHLLLEMAFQAQGGVPLAQHLGVHRAMRLMAGRATFANGFMLEHERAALGHVTLAAGVELRG